MCKYYVYIASKFHIIISLGDIMFKIQKTEYVNRTFRLPKDLVEKLGAYAQEKGISVNELVKQCCEYALSQSDENECIEKNQD